MEIRATCRPRARRHPKTAVPVMVRLSLPNNSKAPAAWPASKASSRKTLLKRLIGDGLRDLERAVRLKDWK